MNKIPHRELVSRIARVASILHRFFDKLLDHSHRTWSSTLEHISVNGSVHTARKRHQRDFMQICTQICVNWAGVRRPKASFAPSDYVQMSNFLTFLPSDNSFCFAIAVHVTRAKEFRFKFIAKRQWQGRWSSHFFIWKSKREILYTKMAVTADKGSRGWKCCNFISDARRLWRNNKRICHSFSLRDSHKLEGVYNRSHWKMQILIHQCKVCVKRKCQNERRLFIENTTTGMLTKATRII